MATTVFVSPGVYTKEQDFTFFASRIGITRLGLIGLTTKGPAFEPIKLASTDELFARFGNTNPNYPLPYVAQAFMGQSSELTITRVLGKVGFTNSPAWVISVPNSGLFSGSTTLSGMTIVSNKLNGTSLTIATTQNANMQNNTISANTTTPNTITVEYSGTTLTTNDWNSAVNAATGVGAYGLIITGFGSTPIGQNSSASITYSSIPNNYSGSTLCVIRSKADANGNFYYTNPTDLVAVGLSSPLGTFTLSGANTTPLSSLTNNSIIVSLDETKKSYIVNALGKTPVNVQGDYGLFVDVVTPHLVRQLYSAGTLSQISGLTFVSTTDYTNYNESYKNSVTPMIVSKVIGSSTRDLFQFETISDGNASANEIKVSIANIDDINKVFDVIVRKFEDTDANTLTVGRLENFRGVTMDDTQPNFIGKVIGTTDGSYPRQSNFITVTMANGFPRNTVPAGFRGYNLRSSSTTGLGAAQILYKTSYGVNDTVSKTYLGISELAYNLFTPDLVGQKAAIKSLEADIFKYQGKITTGTTTIKGFHMESGADPSLFVVGNQSSLSGYTKAQSKFTVVPAGGFDGWNQFKNVTFTEDAGDADNLQAFKDAIDLMAIPETVDVNVFATPDIDWYNHTGAVNYTLSMVEGRADSIYIIDAPRYASDGSQDTAAIATDLQGIGLDSNYAATYWPWIQIFDPNYSQYVFTSPTAQVVKNIALTDNISYPWFAPAGLTRGKVQCIKADVKLTRDDRDVLYDVNINPINTTISEGVTIQGQKTLQVKQSALDRINVRRLLLQVRRLIAAASQTLLFEQNDQTVRDQFIAKVQPLLQQIQNQRGLTAFRVQVDPYNTSSNQTSSDRGTLTGKIQIKPTPALEFIDLTFQVLPTGANFEDF